MCTKKVSPLQCLFLPPTGVCLTLNLSRAVCNQILSCLFWNTVWSFVASNFSVMSEYLPDLVSVDDTFDFDGCRCLFKAEYTDEGFL